LTGEELQSGSAAFSVTTIGIVDVTIISTKPVNTPPFGDILGLSRGQNDISHE
jgi:hypothetical protein